MSMKRHCRVLPLALFLGLAACAQFPEVDRAEAGRAGPRPATPALLPVDTLLDESRFSTPRAAQPGSNLQARAAGLRQRAAALRLVKPAE